MSLFRKKKSSAKLSGSPSTPSLALPTSTNSRSVSAPPLPSPASTTSFHVDDFGRPIEPLPAFAKDARDKGGVPFGGGYGVGDDYDVPQGEMQLLYGYAPLSTTLELSVIKVEDIVHKCATEIRERGLHTPLIMSSMALDISLDGVCSLIRTYLSDPKSWLEDLHLATPLAVGAFLKWGLCRLVNDRGSRGFVSWDLYTEFKNAERATGYPPKSCTVHLISRLSAANGRLLTTLLSFFSSVAAHSATNGMPPRKLAALFSPYVFGLYDDRTFDETYQQWQRATDAFEHIILSFIRTQQADAALPTFLERFVHGYPATLNISYREGEPPQIPKGAKVEEVTRFKRLTRFHSRNLIQQSATWDVPQSTSWKLFSDPSNPTSTPVYTPSYRHLLNIRANHGLDDDGYADDSGEMQKHKTVVEKQWATFGESGFQDVDAAKLEFDLSESERAPPPKRETLDWSTFETAGFAGREIFAPTDFVFHHTLGQRVNTWPSSQKAITAKLRAAEQALPPFPYDTTAREEGRVLVEKDFFEAWADVLVGGGWARDEMKESSFALLQWKARPREGELRRGKVTGSDPRSEDRWLLVEEFVPREYRIALLADPKQAKKESRRVSFMRAVRRKSTSKGPSNGSSAPSAPSRGFSSGQSSFASLAAAPLSSSYARKDSTLRPIDENVFNPAAPMETQHLSLSTLDVARTSYAPSTSGYAASTHYAPSVVSTVRAADGHGPAYSTSDLPSTDPSHFQHSQPPPPLPLPVPVPRSPGVGPGMTLSSQSRESAFGGAGVPLALGYAKPPPVAGKEKGGFLKRMGTSMRTARNGSSGKESPVSGPAPAPARLEAQLVQQAAPNRSVERRSSVPLSPQMRQHSNGLTVPAEERATNGVIPGVPPLGPIVEALHTPEATPPLPPKENPPPLQPYPDEPPYTPTEPTSAPSIAPSDDPYGGIDDSETDEHGAEVGQVLFRGSQSFPRELNAQLDPASRPSITIDGQRAEHVEHPPRRVQVAGLASQTSPPPRKHSLPDSPKPDAEVPVDENDPRWPHQDRYLSGVSQFSSRVANIVGLYEQRDREAVPRAGANGHDDPEAQQPRAEDVRLTQYGFGPGGAPNGGQ